MEYKTCKKSDLDGLVKSSNSRRASFVIVRRTFRTLNDYEMQHNAEVGLFTKPSIFLLFVFYPYENRFGTDHVEINNFG